MEPDLEAVRGRVRELVLDAGDRLREQAGRLPDIGGARKEFLTAEDLRIERELTALLADLRPGDAVWGEELHPDPPGDRGDLTDVEHAWVVDPVSGTSTFLRGAPHYAVVVAHLHRGAPQWALVLDPSTGERFEARRGAGTRLDDRPLHRRPAPPGARRTRVALALEPAVVGTPLAAALFAELADHDLLRPGGSNGVLWAGVAAGRYDGAVALTKDAFPEVAAQLLVTEAGGRFEAAGGGPVAPATRAAVAGAPELVPVLQAALARALAAGGPRSVPG